MTIKEAFEKAAKAVEILKPLTTDGFYGDVKVRIEAGQAPVVDIHVTLK